DASGWLVAAAELEQRPEAPIVHDGRWLRWRRWHLQLQHCLDQLVERGCGGPEHSVDPAVLQRALRRAEAAGVDIAPASVPVSRHNAAINGVTVDVSTTPLEEVEGEYDVVLANILAPVLVALADHLVRVVRPGGRLVISGILAEPSRHQHVLDALVGLEVEDVATLDGWAAITLRRPAA
ncbi:MAG: 50S ribosomal protein L11 methyltransferase, partial [Ilumatobacteraceae bacterium]